MENADRITGKKMLNILEQLKKSRIILKMNILGTGFEALTIVTDLKKETHFIIDFPGGERETVLDSEGKRVFFEFSGEDKIQYSFRASILGIGEKSVKISIPESIDRIQRRKHFRVAVPPGTSIILDLIKKKYEFNVINLSEGGALLNQKAEYHDKGLLFIGGEIRNLYLVNYEDGLNVRIVIKKASIVRIEKKTETGRINYALQFIDLDKDTAEEIKNFIYTCQRRVLQKRSFAGGN